MLLKHFSSGGDRRCQSSIRLRLLVWHFIVVSTVLIVVKPQECTENQYEGLCPTVILSNSNLTITILPTTSPATTASFPATSIKLPTANPSTTPLSQNVTCCLNCSATCETCSGKKDTMCTSCEEGKALLPESCKDLLDDCPSTNCSKECKDEKDICQCMLKSDFCSECLEGMMGQCMEPDKCPDNTQADVPTAGLTDFNVTVCLECEKLFLRFCVNRYRIWIIVAPIAIFAALFIVVCIVCCCCCCRRKEEDIERSTPMKDYPATPVKERVDLHHEPGEMDDHDFQVPAPDPHEDGEIYGNVDDQNNVLMGRAPSAEQDSIRRNIPRNYRQPTHTAFVNTPNNQQPEEDELYGNQETVLKRQDTYVHMDSNVHIDKPRYPTEMEPEEQPIYGNQQPIPRHESVPARRPPSLPHPQKKSSSTFPSGIPAPDFQINEGYEDEDPNDDYPDLPPPSPPMDSLPSYDPPPPPSKPKTGRSVLSSPTHNKTPVRPWERTDAAPGGGGGPESELQQKLKARSKKNEPEDLPLKSPPPIPGQVSLSALQQGLMAGLNKKRESDKRPAPPPLSGFPKRPEPDSDECDETYEPVEYQEDEQSVRQPMPIPTMQKNTAKDPALRPPLALPKKKKTPPAVPFKPPPETQEVYEVVESEDDRDRGRLPLPQEEQQEVYEPIDTSGQSGEVYEITDGPLMSPPAVAFEDDDIYQNTPQVKQGMPSGRYRNLPADPKTRRPPVKEGGYAKWQLK